MGACLPMVLDSPKKFHHCILLFNRLRVTSIAAELYVSQWLESNEAQRVATVYIWGLQRI